MTCSCRRLKALFHLVVALLASGDPRSCDAEDSSTRLAERRTKLATLSTDVVYLEVESKVSRDLQKLAYQCRVDGRRALVIPPAEPRVEEIPKYGISDDGGTIAFVRTHGFEAWLHVAETPPLEITDCTEIRFRQDQSVPTVGYQRAGHWYFIDAGTEQGPYFELKGPWLDANETVASFSVREEGGWRLRSTSGKSDLFEAITRVSYCGALTDPCFAGVVGKETQGRLSVGCYAVCGERQIGPFGEIGQVQVLADRTLIAATRRDGLWCLCVGDQVGVTLKEGETFAMLGVDASATRWNVVAKGRSSFHFPLSPELPEFDIVSDLCVSRSGEITVIGTIDNERVCLVEGTRIPELRWAHELRQDPSGRSIAACVDSEPRSESTWRSCHSRVWWDGDWSKEYDDVAHLRFLGDGVCYIAREGKELFRVELRKP